MSIQKKHVKIVFCHLLDNYTGAPRVLSDLIRTVISQGIHCKLYLGGKSEGVLGNDNILPTVRYYYQRPNNAVLRFCSYLFSQISLFKHLVLDSDIDKSTIIYVNAVMPFGAGLYGFLNGNKVVYHIHEMKFSPRFLSSFLFLVSDLVSSLNIYVSDYQQYKLNVKRKSSVVLKNAISSEIYSAALKHNYSYRISGVFQVLMLSSAREYKGIYEYIKICNAMLSRNDIQFSLVLSETEFVTLDFLKDTEIPNNLTIYPKTDVPEVYYRKSNLVLNLSIPDSWVETFGLTLIEAMSFGIPVIAPPVGGPCEILKEGKGGFLIDSRKTVEVVSRIIGFADDEELCVKYSTDARIISQKNTLQKFSES